MDHFDHNLGQWGWEACVTYHIVAELRIEEMCSHMSGQQIVQNALVRLLQHVHLLLLLRGLQLPQEVQAGSALHQASVHQNGNHEDGNASQRDQVKRNRGAATGEISGFRK